MGALRESRAPTARALATMALAARAYAEASTTQLLVQRSHQHPDDVLQGRLQREHPQQGRPQQGRPQQGRPRQGRPPQRQRDCIALPACSRQMHAPPPEGRKFELLSPLYYQHAPAAGECPLPKEARVLGANGGTGRCLSFRRTPRRSSTCTARNAWRDGDNMIAYPESVVPATLTTELSRRPACDEQLAKQDVGMSQHDAPEPA